MKYPGKIITDKLKRDLTSKCGEERRKLMKNSSLPSIVNRNSTACADIVIVAYILYVRVYGMHACECMHVMYMLHAWCSCSVHVTCMYFAYYVHVACMVFM